MGIEHHEAADTATVACLPDGDPSLYGFIEGK